MNSNSCYSRKGHKYDIGTLVKIKDSNPHSSEQCQAHAGKIFTVSGYYPISQGNKGNGFWGYKLSPKTDKYGGGVWEFEIEPVTEQIFEF